LVYLNLLLFSLRFYFCFDFCYQSFIDISSIQLFTEWFKLSTCIRVI